MSKKCNFLDADFDRWHVIIFSGLYVFPHLTPLDADALHNTDCSLLSLF